MSVENRRYELAADAGRTLQTAELHQPQDLAEAVDYVFGAMLPEVECWATPEQKRAAAAEIAGEIYEDGKDFDLQFALYEHGRRPSDQQLPPERLSTVMLHRCQERRSQRGGAMGRLSVGIHINDETGEQRLHVAELPPTRQKVEISQ